MVVQIGIYQSNSGILTEFWKLKDVAKRRLAQYLIEDYPENILESHHGQVSPGITKERFIPMDGTDIIKKDAKYMEGLEFVRNGDTGTTGLRDHVLNIRAINTCKE